MKESFTLWMRGEMDKDNCCKCDTYPFPPYDEDFMMYLSHHPDYREAFTSADGPDYYTRWKIEPLDFIQENGLDFLRGNIIKYIMRYDGKGGVADLKKARVYLDRLIDGAENGKR